MQATKVAISPPPGGESWALDDDPISARSLSGRWRVGRPQAESV
jgi:hypothetical protein